MVSRTVGASEILKGGLAEGIIPQPEDPKEITARLLAMLERGRDPDFSLEARKLAEGYSWSMHFRKLDRFLKDTVEPSGCGAIS